MRKVTILVILYFIMSFSIQAKDFECKVLNNQVCIVLNDFVSELEGKSNYDKRTNTITTTIGKNVLKINCNENRVFLNDEEMETEGYNVQNFKAAIVKNGVTYLDLKIVRKIVAKLIGEGRYFVNSQFTLNGRTKCIKIKDNPFLKDGSISLKSDNDIIAFYNYVLDISNHYKTISTFDDSNRSKAIRNIEENLFHMEYSVDDYVAHCDLYSNETKLCLLGADLNTKNAEENFKKVISGKKNIDKYADKCVDNGTVYNYIIPIDNYEISIKVNFENGCFKCLYIHNKDFW